MYAYTEHLEKKGAFRCEALLTDRKGKDGRRGVAILYHTAEDCVLDNIENIQSGIWRKEDTTTNSPDWTYGSDYRNWNATKEAILNGRCLDKFIDRIYEQQSRLFEQFPELYELERTAYKVRRRRVFREDGDELDIDRHMAGEYECWQKRTPQKVKNSIRIFVHIGQNANESPDSVTKNMIQLAAVCDIIEKAGITTEIWVGAHSVHDKSGSPIASHALAAIKAKDANQPMDISKLMSMGAPGMFRHLIFGMRGNCIPQYTSWDMGSSTQDITEVGKEMIEHIGFDICVFGRQQHEKLAIMMEGVRKLLGDGETI